MGRENHNRKGFKKVVDFFCGTPVRTCKGERFLVTGGISSGSCFTNLIESIINCNSDQIFNVSNDQCLSDG